MCSHGVSPSLTYEIRPRKRFFFRQAVLFSSKGDALDQEGHVLCQGPHDLQPFFILRGFLGAVAVDAVATGIPLIVKYLFNPSKVADRPPRLADTTLAPTFIVLSKGVL